MSNQHPYLTGLVMLGELKDFEFEHIESEFSNGSAETQRLTLTLPSGKKIVIESIYSGYLENTSLVVSNK